MRVIHLYRKMRMVAVAVVALMAPVVGAQAHFAGNWHVIGFSEDGRYFAFEHSGEDDMGWPFQTLYVLDREKDEYVDRTPRRVRWGEADPRGSLGLLALRQSQNYRVAEIKRIRNIIDAGSILVATTLEGAPKQVRFGMDNNHGLQGAGPDRPLHLELVTTDRRASRDCQPYGDTSAAYELILDDPYVGRRLLHSDRRIPSSRGCPVDYAITAVVKAHNGGYVALISVLTQGFEGADRAFVTVPFDIEE